MPTWLPLLLLFARPLAAEPSLHKLDVRIVGAVATVELWRTVEAGARAEGDRQTGRFLDLDLPEGAALVDFELVEGSTRTPLSPESEVRANAALAAGLKLQHLSVPAPPDEGTDFRVHLAPIGQGERAVLHARYTVPVGCREGRLALRIPESLEASAPPADVTVTIEALPDGARLAEALLAGQPATLRPGARRAVLRATVRARPAWEIAWRYAKPSGTLPGTLVAAAARVSGVSGSARRARSVPRYALAGLVCRSDAGADHPPPERVLLLVDRSRSVGQGGLSAERLLAGALIEALPPSIVFNGVLFGTAAEPVFPLSRMPTREALDGLARAADPNRLENGTDVVAALARARGLLDADASAGQAWVVLLTDGALPASQTAERMQAALLSPAGRQPKVLVLLVRQYGDEEVAPGALAEYARLARRFGGLVRVVAPSSPAEVAQAVRDAMAKGGDLLDVRLEEGKLADAVPPGRGASLRLITAARLPGERRVRLLARGFESELRAESTPSPIARLWLDPLFEPAEQRRAWTGATAGMAVVVLPGPAAAKAVDGIVRGRMDPTVLKNALALAFIPRARACYLSRRVASAGDALLSGRLKLELDLERGELHDAVVRQSTLGNPAIEECVRRAAWAIEYPRPEHRDAPTLANVNLVFSPRTPKESVPSTTATDREIELVVGPLTPSEQYRDLLGSPDGGP